MNLNFFKTWFNVLIKPKETFQKEKKNVSINKGVINYYIVFLFYFILWFIIGYLLDSEYMLKPIEQNAMILLAVLVAPLAITILVSIWQGIIALVSAAFKGKGKIEEQYYLISLAFIPVIVIYSIKAMFLNSIDFEIKKWIDLLLFVYLMYLMVLALEETHQYGKIKAIITVILSLVIILLPFFIFISLFTMT